MAVQLPVMDFYMFVFLVGFLAISCRSIAMSSWVLKIGLGLPRAYLCRPGPLKQLARNRHRRDCVICREGGKIGPDDEKKGGPEWVRLKAV